MDLPDNEEEALEMPWTQINNSLAMNLYKLLSKEKQNLIFSPLSIATALAAQYIGATEDIRQELEKVLRFGDTELASDSEISDSFCQMASNLQSNPACYTLAFDNAFLLQKGIPLSSALRTALIKVFRAFVLEVDFAKESKKISHQINNWVSEITNEGISEIVDYIDGNDTTMAILNAVRFEGSWMQKFSEQSTYLECFCHDGEDDSDKEVEMMHLEEFFLFVEKDSFKALQLPLKSEEMAMLFLLPHSKNAMEEIESMLTPRFLQELKNEMHLTKVDVELPKFRMEYSKSLKDILQSLGLDRALRSDKMVDPNKLEVSELIHRAVMEVNEQGCSAATSTAMLGSVKSSPHQNFVVDHPFVFFLYDTRTDLILFLGKVDQL